MARETTILRGVRHEGRLFKPQDRKDEQELSAVLDPESAARLIEKEVLSPDFKATGEKREVPREKLESNLKRASRDEGPDRPQGIEKDEEGEPIGRVPLGAEDPEGDETQKVKKPSPRPTARPDGQAPQWAKPAKSK